MAKATTKKKTLKKGDKVSWGASQGKTVGKVVAKVSGKASVKGYKAKASAAQPQYKVKSEKTGKLAIHKPASLKKRK